MTTTRMPKPTKPKASPKTIPRQRLARPERGRQLLDISWKLIGDEGTDALTLGRVAEVAGVSKPVVYEHFGTRNGLLAALYQDFDILQTERIDASVAAARPELNDKAGIIASSYVACVLTQGREIPGVLAALSGSPELATLKRQYQKAFIGKCHDALAAFAGTRGIPAAAMWAMLGAAESLSNAALAGDITQEQATAELQQTILGMVARSQ